MARKKKKNLWIISEANIGTVGLYGHYFVNVDTREMLYMARKKNRSTGIHHKTNTISVDLKTLTEAKEVGVKAVVISFTQSKDRFITDITNFFEVGERNYDDGDKAPQIRLAIAKFIERRSEEL